MKNKISLKNRMISLGLTLVMAMGLIYLPPVKAAGEVPEGRYQLTLDYDLTLTGSETVTDDAGYTCALSEITYIKVARDSHSVGHNLIISGNVNLGNATIETAYNCSIQINDGGYLTVNSVEALVVNHGTIEAESIVMSDGGGSARTFYNYGTMNTVNLTDPSYGGKFYNESGSKLTVTGTFAIYANIEFINDGECSVNTFDLQEHAKITNNSVLRYGETSGKVFATDSSEFENGSITNNGTISADRIRLTTHVQNTSSAVYKPVTGIEITGYNSENIGTVIAEPDTWVSIDGGGFTLEIGEDLSDLVVASQDDYAIELIGYEPTFTVSEPGQIYVGQEYDLTDYISYPSDYPGVPDYQMEYAPLMGDAVFEEAAPTEAGTYQFHAYVPAQYPYKSGYVPDTIFSIDYLPLDECDTAWGSSYFTLSGVENEVYAKDSITLTPAEGYLVLRGGEEEWQSSVILTKEDVFPSELDGNYNDDLTFRLKRSDDAETDFYSAAELCAPILDLVFDEADPVISGTKVDGKAASIADEDQITAKNVVISIKDENLDSIVTPGKSYSRENGGVKENGGVWTADVDFTAEKGTSKKCTITAYDLSGRTTDLMFHLDYLKDVPTVSLSIDDIFVNDPIKPDLKTDSDGTPEYLYKPADADDSSYSGEEPTAAGKYKALVKIAETDGYELAKAETTFTISRREATASIRVADALVGEPIAPDFSTNSNGTATIYYKPAGSDDSNYTTEVPTAAGTYNVVAKVPETFTYEAVTATTSFTISKNAAKASISVADCFVWDEVKPQYTTNSDAEQVTILYKASGADDISYSTEAPTTVGTYVVFISVPETFAFEAAYASSSFTISRRSAEASIKMADGISGLPEYAPTLETVSDGIEGIEYYYKSLSAPDDSFTDAWPIAAGDYTVLAIIPQTDNYEAVSCRDDFTLSYLERPSVAYVMRGTTGDNGYYTTKVNIEAPEGFSISRDGVIYSSFIPYSEDIEQIYLRRTDGALTGAIPLPGKLKIDMDIPDIAANDVDVNTVTVFFRDNLELVITDDKLASVIVNKTPVEVKDGVATILLDPENGAMDFVIVATDEAGNTREITITLSALWLKDKVIPDGVSVPLEPETEYILGEGEWSVDSDPTVYQGGSSVYLDEKGKHTFHSVK